MIQRERKRVLIVVEYSGVSSALIAVTNLPGHMEMTIKMIESNDGWKLMNYFRDWPEAEKFCERMRKSSAHVYTLVGPYQWYCQYKKTSIRIEME